MNLFVLTEKAIDALRRTAARDGVSQDFIIESALVTYDTITAMQADGNTFYRVNSDGDLIEVNLSVPYFTET